MGAGRRKVGLSDELSDSIHMVNPLVIHVLESPSPPALWETLIYGDQCVATAIDSKKIPSSFILRGRE